MKICHHHIHFIFLLFPLKGIIKHQLFNLFALNLIGIFHSQTFYRYLLYLLKFQDTLRDHKQKNDSYFKKIKEKFYKNLWTDTARELGAEIQTIGYDYYKIQLGGNSTYVRNSLVMLDNCLTLRIAGNKPLVDKILYENKYPIVKFLEYDLNGLKEANKFIERIYKPCVVKPAQSGAAGKGITTEIKSWKSLEKASLQAAIYDEKLMIEEQVEGDSYRLLYLNGEFLDAIRRKPPHIIGDGKSTIRKLIENENSRRKNGKKIISLFPLTIDSEMKFFLNTQGYHLRDVLPQNKSITVKRVVNQNSCFENESVKSIVHPAIIEMGLQIVKLFNIKLAGIDLITTDITRPLNETNGVINEVNTTPGLHHHYLISNEAEITPVAFHILKYLLNSH